MSEIDASPNPQPPRLLDQVKQVMRLKHYSLRTEESYIYSVFTTPSSRDCWRLLLRQRHGPRDWESLAQLAPDAGQSNDLSRFVSGINRCSGKELPELFA